MKFISSLCWVPQGKSITPTQLKIGKNEMKQIFADDGKKYGDDEDDEEIEEPDQSNNEEQEDAKIDKRYNMDDYDDEDDDIRVENLKSLACFSNNHDDKLLTIKDDGEDSDNDDFELRKDDNLLVAGHFDEDICSLNIYVYNCPERHFYIHHDLMLGSYPVCLEWLDYDPTEAGSVNYLAVGTLNPWIEIWDLDIVDSLEPEFILGSQKKIKKKKDQVKKQKILGHRDAVLDLSWNKLNTTVLASGSADKSIILWDLEKLKMATRIKSHTQKVQSLQWHPIESFSLLSGSSDKTVALYDCRNPKENKKTWTLEGEVEQVLWNQHAPNYFLSCDDMGTLNMIDIRMDTPVVVLKAHEDSINSISMSSKVPGLLLTGADDEIVKVWDVKSDAIEFVYEKKFHLGEINTLKSSPDSQFAFGIGGAKESAPIVWDCREVAEIRRQFYPRMDMPLELVAKELDPSDIKDKRTRRSKSFSHNKNFTNKRRKNKENSEINKCVKKRK